ncbi:hypothetical protein SCANM63S_03979 [Streptomyces canarius]
MWRSCSKRMPTPEVVLIGVPLSVKSHSDSCHNIGDIPPFSLFLQFLQFLQFLLFRWEGAPWPLTSVLLP